MPTPPESDRFLIVTADDFGLHPATLSGTAISPSMAAYRHLDELAALLSPRVRALLGELRLPSGGYGDCRNHRTASSIAC